MQDSCLMVTSYTRTRHYRDYDSNRIANLLRRYQELRSAAEITAVHYERINTGRSSEQSKDDIICILTDIDQGMTALSPRQLGVVRLLQMGYKIDEIGLMLGISTATVKARIQQAVVRLVAYLNSSH